MAERVSPFPPFSIKEDEMRIGLALGGGGARGWAHLGVLKFLEEINLKFDFIVGTSAGGLVAALYAHYGSVENVVQEVKSLLNSPKYKNYKIEDFSVEENAPKIKKAASSVRETFMIARGLVNVSLISAEVISGAISDLLPDIDIKDLPMETAYVATDLVSGKDIVMVGGNLRKAVQATGSIPGIFPPVSIGKMVLVDGGATQKVPVLPSLAMGADAVIAVDVSKKIGKKHSFKSAFEIMLRIDAITSDRLNHLECLISDVLIHPNVNNIEWYEFEKLDEAFDRGYSEAQKKRKELMNIQTTRHIVAKKIRQKLSGFSISFKKFMEFYEE